MPAMSKRAKRVLITLGALVVLAVLWFQFVNIYFDWAWFGEVGYRNVFTTQLITRIILFLIGALVAGGLVLGSLLIAFRSRPVFVPGNEVDPLAPYRTVVTARPKLFSFAIAIVIALVCGLSAQGEWETVQLWLNAQSFGTVDPQFGHDVGFYVFSLPLWEMLLGWLLVLTGISFVLVLVVQYLFGGIRVSGPGRKISAAATLQLSLLVGFFVLVKAVRYWFDRYDLLFSNRGGSFTGASYTDINAVLPAKIILMCIAAICAVGFVVGAFLRSVRLPAIALALLVLSSVLIGGIWPLVLQQVVVNPNAISREPPYIARSIAATQAAYGLGDDKVTYVEYPDENAASPRDLLGTQTVNNARLLDPNILSDTFTQRQQQQNFYGFAEQLTIDRYPTEDGGVQDYIVALRELNVDGLQAEQKNWINEHLVYTHGNGLVAAPANSVVDGYPAFTVSDLNNKGAIPVDEPRIYYGQLATDYAIVGSESADVQREYDTPTTNFTYTGKGGVGVGNLLDRLIFATHYGEANFLFSSEINGNSKILYYRDPAERVQKAAPFLTIDTKPYPAAVNGRIVWIVDGYTTAQHYPYSREVTLSDATNNSQSASGQAQGQVNEQVSYIRNSVKATVDAYDGTVTLYSVDDTDPVLKAWEGVFPGLIKPSTDVTPELRDHFRYPQDLFEVQRSLLTQYHLESAVDFFQNSNFWRVPDDPTESGVTAAQPPYYQQVQLPGQADSSFQLTSALTGFYRQFLQAYVSVDSDPENYGKITVLQLNTETTTPGPLLIQQTFAATESFSNFITTRQNQGTQVIYGNLLTLPTSEGLLYVEPLYLRGVSTSAAPQLNKVVVWFNKRVGIGDTLTEALESAAASAPVEVVEPPGDGTPTVSGSASISSGSVPPTTTDTTGPTSSEPLPSNAAEALAVVEQANQRLEDAKSSGNLVAIAEATDDLSQAVDNYIRLVGPATASSTLPPSVTSSSGG
ncbi:UPF0182 family membrane protein [Nakamurella alba]